MPHFCRLTCTYLSCKVDEFNVSSTQFVGNLQESPMGQERALEQILEYELLLIQQLNFHLVVHNPYRPLEGFLIDLKVSLKPGCRQSHPKCMPLLSRRAALNFWNVLTADYLSAWFLYSQTRYPLLENPEMLRKSAEDFLNRAAMTNAGLLFSPSQLALTAVLNGAARAGLKMEA